MIEALFPRFLSLEKVLVGFTEPQSIELSPTWPHRWCNDPKGECCDARPNQIP